MNHRPPLGLVLILLAGASLVARATPPLPGTISDNIGYSRATDFVDPYFQTLAHERVADNPNTVLLLAYMTPW